MIRRQQARLVCAALLLLSCGAIAQEPALPRGVERGPSAGGITEYRFSNGLRAVLFPDASKPTITVNVTVLVGSRHEGYGETGMAHLLEHMVFKGTVKRPKLVEEFAPRGARRNGTTNVDRTNYFETFPASDDNLRWALDLEADRLVNSTVRREDLDSEMTVVRNEYERGENEPGAVLNKRLSSVAFDWHNYQNSTIGNRSDIENVGIDNLRAFYRTYYQPDNAVLVVAGKFETGLALATIAETFGAIPKPTRTLPKLWTVEPTQDGERTFTVRRAGEVPLVALAYKAPGVRHPDNSALSLAAAILGSSPGGPLYKALVDPGKAVNVGSAGDVSAEPGLARFSVALKPGGNLDEAEAILVKTVESFADAPPTDVEVKRAKDRAARAREQLFANPEALGLALTASIAQGDWRLVFYLGDRLDAVTPDEVRSAAAKYFRRDNRTLGRFIPTDAPQRVEITPAPLAEVLLKDFKGREGEAAVAEFEGTPANIQAHTRVEKLPSGLKVALLPKPSRGQEVRVRLVMRGGDLGFWRGKTAAAALMGATLTRGTMKMGRQEISDRMTALRMNGVIGTTTSFRTTREHLADAIVFASHVLHEANFPETEVEQARAQLLTALQSSKADVNTLARTRLQRHQDPYPADDPRYSPTPDELIARVRAVKREDVVALHRELMGTSYAQMAVVGDFDADAILPVIAKELGDWRSPRAYVRIEQTYRDVQPLTEVIRIPEKASATFIAGLLLNTREDDPMQPEYPALIVANHVFGASGFSSRLFSRIRGKEGLSYGVSSGLSNNSLDHVAHFTAVATAAPDNMPKVDRAFREELQRLYDEGITQDELDKAKQGIAQSRSQSRTQDETLAAVWIEKLYRDRTWAETERADRALQAVTREDVLHAVRMHLDPKKLNVIEAGSLP